MPREDEAPDSEQPERFLEVACIAFNRAVLGAVRIAEAGHVERDARLLQCRAYVAPSLTRVEQSVNQNDWQTDATPASHG